MFTRLKFLATNKSLYFIASLGLSRIKKIWILKSWQNYKNLNTLTLLEKSEKWCSRLDSFLRIFFCIIWKYENLFGHLIIRHKFWQTFCLFCWLDWAKVKNLLFNFPKSSTLFLYLCNSTTKDTYMQRSNKSTTTALFELSLLSV